MALWCVSASFVLLALGLFIRFHFPTALAMTILIAWLALDALWQRELMGQLRETRLVFAGKTVTEKHLQAEDQELYRFAMRVKSSLPEKEVARVFILRQGSGHNFRRLKTQYYLLPHNTFNYGRYPRKRALRPGDFVLAIDSIDGLVYDVESGLLRWPDSAVAADLVHSESIGDLYRIRAVADG